MLINFTTQCERGRKKKKPQLFSIAFLQIVREIDEHDQTEMSIEKTASVEHPVN